MAPLSDERLAEIRDLSVDSCSGDAPYNSDVWTLEKARQELVAEVERLRAELTDLQGQNAMTESHFSNFAADSILELERLKQQRTALIALHEYDELIFGGFICTHCTPTDGDPDTTVMWPCPSLRAVGVTDDEAIALIKARRAEIEKAAREGAEAPAVTGG